MSWGVTVMGCMAEGRGRLCDRCRLPGTGSIGGQQVIWPRVGLTRRAVRSPNHLASEAGQPLPGPDSTRDVGEPRGAAAAPGRTWFGLMWFGRLSACASDSQKAAETTRASPRVPPQPLPMLASRETTAHAPHQGPTRLRKPPAAPPLAPALQSPRISSGLSE